MKEMFYKIEKRDDVYVATCELLGIVVYEKSEQDVKERLNKAVSIWGSICSENNVLLERLNNIVLEALSARDKEWEEKIEKYHDKVPFHNFTVYMTEDEWQSLLTQMKEGK